MKTDTQIVDELIELRELYAAAARACAARSDEDMFILSTTAFLSGFDAIIKGGRGL